MTLVPIIYKKSRLLHRYKCYGAVLNCQKQYYIQRVKGQQVQPVLNVLSDIAQGKNHVV